MSGQLRKDDIIQQKEIQDALAAIAKSVEPIIAGFKKVAEAGREISKSVGGVATLKELVQVSKLQAQADTNLAKSKKALIDVENKVIQQLKLESQARKAELETVKKQLELLIKEQHVKQAKIATDTKVINQIKAEQNAINAETIGRKKNVDVLIAEERLKQQKIRTDKLEHQEIKKKTGAFSDLIRSIGVYAAAMFGLTRIIQFFTRDLLNMVKTLDSLDFSMKTIIKSQEELAQTQLFLSQTAYSYGQDILTLTERYIKFRAAAQQSNMSVRDTQKIFDSTAKAAAVLGLKTDEVNGVFLALEQMISKGKVTTEELRRQLGERLPGAFGIMADAMGVPISELDRMLKAGEVLSTEALPKFAVALEKAYGIESVTKVDTLAAAQGRLRTSWVEFIDSLQASDAYITTINSLADAFNDIRFSFGLIDEIDKMSRQVGKGGDAVRSLIDIYDDLGDVGQSKFKDLSQYQSDWIKKLGEAGVSEKTAIILFNQYVAKRRQSIIQDNKNTQQITPFDLDGYKKIIESAEKEYEDMSLLQDGVLKEQVKQNSAFYKENQKTYKEYLQNQISELYDKTKIAENLYNIEKSFQEGQIAEGNEITKEQKQQLDIRYRNYQNYINASIILQNELNGDKNTVKSKKDDSLAVAKKENELKIAILEKALTRQAEIDGESKTKELERETLLLETKKQLNDELLQYVKGGSKDYYDIWATSYDLQVKLAQKKASILKDIDDDFVKQNEKTFKIWDEQRKEESDAEISSIYEQADLARIARAEQAVEEIQDKKGSAKKKRSVEIKAAIDMLAIEYDAQQKIIESNLTTEEAKAEAAKRQKELEEQLQKEALDGVVETEKLKRDEYRKTIDAISKLGQQGFNIVSNLYDNQLSKIESNYEYESKAAGDSVERKIIAERKYEREKAKLMRKQAIAQKAQSAFNIIINTAEAIMATLGETGFFGTPLAVIIGAMGAAELATVLAAPIPEYAEGTQNAPETFIAGDAPKGSGKKGAKELILKPDGSAVLTTDKPTLFSDKSFIGSTIFPHDETQKWLANYAVSQSYDVIDMSESNTYLKKIARNTSGKKEIFIQNGSTYIKRGYITSRVI